MSFVVICLVLCLAVTAGSSSASDDSGFFNRDTPVEITADYLDYDKENNTYLARGNVVITQEGTTMKTRAATVNMTTGEAATSGRVTITDRDGNTLSGEDLSLNINKRTAVIAKGRLFYKKDNVYIEGDPLQKTGPESYAGKKLKYSTCDCPEGGGERAWSFSVSDGKVTVGKVFTGRNALFRIKGVPVLYSPFVVAPVKRPRQTGFLMPRPGFSELRGFVLDNTFFWAISRNMDATFYLDVEASRGLGEGAEFRYIRKRQSYGEVSFYHFSEDDIDRVRRFRDNVENLSRPESATNERWQFKLQHTEVMAYGINIKADINRVSDEEYFIDFGYETDRSLESLESNISISKSWSIYSLVTQFRLFDNLLTADDSATLAKLPEITFTASKQKIFFSSLYLSLNSSLIHFSRDEGVTGQRLDLQPRLALALSPGGYFDFNASFAPRGTFYLVKEDPNGRYIDRYLYDASADVTTTFVRVFFTGPGGARAFKHTLRPRIAYTFIPEAVHDNLPGFDSVDSIAATNRITYSLNSILTGRYPVKDRKEYLDYLYLEVSQSFDINESTRRLASATDQRRPFSEINGELILKPSTWSKVTGKLLYNVYDRRASSYYAEVYGQDSRGDSLSISHRFVRDETNFIEGSARAHVNRALALTYHERFSLDEERSIERSYGIEYSRQCWGAVLTYTDNLEEQIIYLTFNLRGLGSVAGIKGTVR